MFVANSWSGDGSPTHEIIQRINGKVGQRTVPDPRYIIKMQSR